jgi:hypothetical protein
MQKTIYIYTDPTDRIVQRYISIIYKLKISTISYIYIYTRNQLFATHLKQIEYSHREPGFTRKFFDLWTLDNILSASALVYILSITVSSVSMIFSRQQKTYIKCPM